ncbi:polysaccharide deacetylase family protein [Dethiothermospora halolimnae]|uniref:polysaccharide deacetylase family protein n=1 Tax=Dethiothermospora halolimnae TaxID=3114390 RepID=UPI003CCC0738
MKNKKHATYILIIISLLLLIIVPSLYNNIQKPVEKPNSNSKFKDNINSKNNSSDSNKSENPIIESKMEFGIGSHTNISKKVPKENNNTSKSPKEQKQSISKSENKKKNKQFKWNGQYVYLTFDDGPSKETKTILQVLRKENIKATFFVTGTSTKENTNLLKQIVKDGHKVGNHSYSHDYSYIYSSVENFFKDFYKNQKIIYNTTGINTSILRLPGGSNNTVNHKYGGQQVMNEIISRLYNEGYLFFDWNITSGDAYANGNSAEYIVNKVLNEVNNTNTPIILMHDNNANGNTKKALPIIIKRLKNKGYKFGVLSRNSPRVVLK